MGEWRGFGRCAVDPDAWFPEGSSGHRDVRAAQEAWAKAQCLGCTVLDMCRVDTAEREAGLSYSHWHGVSAGESAAERVARVKRERAQAAGATVAA